MRYFVGIAMGLISGLILYFMAALFLESHGKLAAWVVPVFFLGGWVFSSWLFIRDTKTTARVASRAFLFGTFEWVVMIVAGLWASGRGVAETAPATHGQYGDAAAAGAVIGGGLSFMLIAGLSVLFAIVCLIGFLATKNMGQELQAETSTKRCPQCAENIQAEARKCRFCGSEIAPLSAPA